MIPSSSLRSYNYNDDPNPNSRPQDDPPPLSLDHFPSPFLDHHHDHNQLLFFTHDNINSPPPQQFMAHDDHVHGGAYINILANQNTQDISMINTTDDHPTPSSELAPRMINKSTNKGSTKKQRKSRKDRHSKICTAQGIRDRRMRLSLQIARKFFDLQDMLGFDKASKTIDWLFSESKNAIKKLNCTTTNHLPQINMLSTNTAYHNNTTGSEMSDSSMSSECEVESEGENVSGERKTRKSQAAAYGIRNSPINAREIRDKARARARERTREKMMIRYLEKSKQFYLSDQTSTTTYNLAKLGSSTAANPNSNFETFQESSMNSYTTQERTISPHEYSSSPSSLHYQMADVGIIASSAAPATSCSIFDYQENDALFSGGFGSYSKKFLGLLGNWDIKSNNSAITPNMVPTLTEKSKTPSSVFTENSKFHHFQSQYLAE